ncbi:SDR family NAD(P)-dependent oxidoreductase [Pendulispora brunnea]|uniref:SDR family NAD(P)-dependent oxidoreductase n=1 Tax=Pendulispora brunnea TaxID=2905690 RepID=A0ABZ2K4E5_9BACT
MSQTPIAVIGISALFPGSTDAKGFWSDILAGRDLVSEVPPTHWLIEDYYDPNPAAPDKTYCKRGAFLGPVDFDPMEFGVPPNIMPATDTAQLLALIVAQKVLDDVGESFKSIDREKVSVILGVTSGQELLGSMVSRLQRPIWLKALRDSGIAESEAQSICERIANHYVPWQESSFPGLLGNVVAGRIANRFDLHGTNCVTDAACASALSALSMGMNELAVGQSDLVITGGVDTMNDILMYMCFSKTPALSPTGDCRPFASAADGTLLGEGMAMLALRRLEDAERDGNRIYGVIRGLGSSSDGRSKSVYAPLPEGQARALRRAYEQAGYGPESVELMEGHGTATKAGDVAEFTALKQVFGESARGNGAWCALGSVKSQIGHTKASAGIAGLLKTVLALHHKVLPPTIKVDAPNPNLEIEQSPFYLNTHARPWIRESTHARRASVSSFGFGGSNFHVALEEYVGSAPKAFRLRSQPSELFVLAAPSAKELASACRTHVAKVKESGLSASARASQAGFDSSEGSRLAVVASSADELVAKLEQAAGLLDAGGGKAFSTPTGIHYDEGALDGSIAFLFSGQGSQYVGMGADLAMAFDAAREVWDDAAALQFDGVPVHEVVFPRPVFSDADREAQAARLTATEWAQPAIGVTSLAALSVLREAGVHPDAVAGHSFGEVTALCAAGALDAKSLVAVARARGTLMRDAATTPGAMTAVPLPIDEVRPLVDGTDVVIANHNHPTQVVLSGSVEAIERIERALTEKKVNAKRLPVATAFHSPLVSGASAQFGEFLAKTPFRTPVLDVYSNTDADLYTDDVRTRLAEQLARPVRFVDQIEKMWERGVRTFVEVGPGAVLTDFVTRTLGERPHRAIATDRKGRHGVTSLNEALGRLAVAGVAVDFSILWSHDAPVRDTPARKKPQMAIAITGANVGKPYPPPHPQPRVVVEEPKPRVVVEERRAPVHIANGANGMNGTNGLNGSNGTNGSSLMHKPVRAHVAPVTREVEKREPVAWSPDAQVAWLQAYQEAQRTMAEAHATYQRITAESHMAFLKAAETSYSALAAMVEPSSTVSVASAPALITSYVAPPPPPPPVEEVPFVEAQPAPPPAPVAPVVTHAAPPPPPPAPKEAPAPVAAPAPAPGVDLEALLLTVVADKTGYPVEMLGMHMELEADLGVDSIKRVEILSGMRERAPGLPEVVASEMAALRTLGQIVGYMRERGAVGEGGARPFVQTGRGTSPLPSAPEQARTSRTQRYVVQERPAPAAGLAQAGLLGAKRVVVTDDATGVAQALARTLVRAGLPAEVVAEVPADADAVIFLGGLRPVASVDEALAVDTEAFHAARAVAKRFSNERGVFVTVQDTGGDFGLAGKEPLRAWLGGVAALARTAALEWNQASVKAIDVERADRSAEALAEVLAAELLEGGSAREVGLHGDGTRTTLASVPVAIASGTRVLNEQSVLVVSGGARGVTASSLVALVRQTRARVALFGRTPLTEEPAVCRGQRDDASLKRVLLADARARGESLTPATLGAQVARIVANREIRATLDAIHDAGGQVRYFDVDVQDTARLHEALASIRQTWGPITGIVHGAGVLADKFIAEKTPEQFAKVFGTKVLGLRALLDATASDPLALIALFSSVAARTGNPGQSDYAMANEVLNAIASAERRRRQGACVVKSIGWGPWEGGMVTPALKALFEERKVPLLSIEDGANRFVQEVQGSPDEVVTVIGGELGAAPERVTSVEARVDRSSHPFLVDHSVGSRVVLPMVMALDWLVRAAHDGWPESRCIELRDLKVLRGIKLERYDTGGDVFTVTCRPRPSQSEQLLQAELRGAGNALHYNATLVLAPSSPTVQRASVTEPSLGPWTKVIYDGHILFHGPKFQMIRAIEGVSRDGMVGTLHGVRELGWSHPSFQTDPGILDGALQLAGLWACHVLGGATLPMAIARYRIHQALPEGDIRCIVHGRQIHHARGVADVALVDAQGRLVGELLGVENVLRPGEPLNAAPESAAHAI